MTWTKMPLGDFAPFSYGKGLSKQDRRGEVVNVFGSNGVVGTHDTALVDEPGVIVGRKGSVGEVHFSPEPFWPIDTTFYVVGSGERDIRFAYYLLKHLKLRRLSGDSAVPGLNRDAAHSEEVTVPDPTTQRVIGSILGSIDELVENNRRRIEILEEMAQAIYREWFVHFRFPGHEDATFVDSPLGPIPEGWETRKFGDLVDLRKQTVDPAEIAEGSVLVGLEHIPRQQLTLDRWELAAEVGSRKATFSHGDILFGKIRPYFHKVSIAPTDGYCSSDALVFRPEPGMEALAASVAFSKEFVDLASATANGTKMPRANWDVLAGHEVPLPPLRLLEDFTALFSPAVKQCEGMMFANQRLSGIRDLLLPKLVTGEIDVSSLDLDGLIGAAS